MSEATVQVEQVVFARDDKRGEDGYVIYLILMPCTDQPCNHVCSVHPRREHHYERQAFRRGAFGHRLDATPEEIKAQRANVWGWDGDRQAPTLMPSFLAKEDRPYTLHSFLNGGKLDLCGDSTVRLIDGVSCWDDAHEDELHPAADAGADS